MKTVASYSIKGGVGKTTSCVNVAYEAARSGARVLLWDLDPQGAATFFLRVKPKVKGGVERLIGKGGVLEPNIRASEFPGLHVVPADFSLRHLDLELDERKRPTRRLAALLEPLADTYDVAILDCAPGITLASESVFRAVDALLVPTVPTPLSQRMLEQLVEFLAEEKVSPLLLPFISMIDRRRKLQRDLAAALHEHPGFLQAGIPNASIIERMGLERAPVGVYAPKSDAAAAFRSLWSEVASRLWE